MTLNPELLTHASDPELIAGAAEEMQQKIAAGVPMEIVYRPETVFALVGVMQLALRHAGMGLYASPHDAAERFLTAAREYFADCPHVLEMIRRGGLQEYDRG